jgi:hypothetical protein
MSRDHSANFKMETNTQQTLVEPVAAMVVGSDPWLGLPLTPELRRHFPKPCKPRKAHHCRLCAGKIEVGELCCKWEYLEPGEGYGTSHAHPECYQVTLDGKWDDGDWECASPGDVSRPNVKDEPDGGNAATKTL